MIIAIIKAIISILLLFRVGLYLNYARIEASVVQELLEIKQIKYLIRSRRCKTRFLTQLFI